MRRRRERKTRLKIKIHLPRKLLIFIVFGALLFFPFFLFQRLVKINNFSCESQYGPCSTAIENKLSTLNGKSLNFTKNELNRFFATELMVEKYSARFIFPSKIQLDVIEKKPIIALANENEQSKFALVDKNGVIIAIVDKNQLPVIVLKEKIELKSGDQLNEELKFSKSILEQAFKLYGSRLSFWDSNSLEVDLQSGVRVIFPLAGDTQILFGSLSLILSRLQPESQTSKIGMSVIDLRYKNPVVKFNEN